MRFIKYHIFTLLIIFNASSIFSQSLNDSSSVSPEVIYNSSFGLAPGGTLEFATPQKYGGTVHLTLGKVTEEGLAPGQISKTIKGVNLEAGLFRGGQRFGLYYANLGYSIIGVAGTRIGMVYLRNDSFSRVLNSSDLIGVEAELFTIYKFKVGILKAVESDKYIPSLGFGFGIGPFF